MFGSLGFGDELIGIVGVNRKAYRGAGSMALGGTRQAAMAATGENDGGDDCGGGGGCRWRTAAPAALAATAMGMGGRRQR